MAGLGALSAAAVLAMIVLGVYLLVLAIFLPFFVYRIYQDIGEIKRHTMGMSFDINSAAQKMTAR